MPFWGGLREQVSLVLFLLKWLALAVPLGALVGSACALFLISLEAVTLVRLQHPNLVYLLPVAGVLIGWLYFTFGQSVEAGNNLIVDEIHDPGHGVPLRMVPMVLFATIWTHLFGGSAGREGTAVQMGGSIASGMAKLLPRLDRSDVRILLMAGISAGFGGVFGTPVAGAIFALEVLSIGRMNYAGIVPCLIAGIASDQTCIAWGVTHTHYHINSQLIADSAFHSAPLSFPLLGLVVLAASFFGMTSILFAELVHGLHHIFKQWIASPVLRPAVGGVLVLALMGIVGSRDYLGLGVSSTDPDAVTIVSCFRADGAHPWSWFWKIVFTAVTLASGFKGGEVTPLFFIGAALGNSLALLFGAPVDLFAALGFVSVFAGATNTPIACTIMAIELFGSEYTLYFAVSCLVAYVFSGHSGIYLSQRIGSPKLHAVHFPAAETLRATREARLNRVRVPGARAIPQSAKESVESTVTRDQQRFTAQSICQLRIFLTDGATRQMQFPWSLWERPLYRELIQRARSDGIASAISYPLYGGYVGVTGPVPSAKKTSVRDPNVCVELIDLRERLDAFCSKHRELLTGTLLTSREIEQWEAPL